MVAEQGKTVKLMPSSRMRKNGAYIYPPVFDSLRSYVAVICIVGDNQRWQKSRCTFTTPIWRESPTTHVGVLKPHCKAKSINLGGQCVIVIRFCVRQKTIWALQLTPSRAPTMPKVRERKAKMGNSP